jgi:MFS superfamily sulfate permease-like transporter
MVLDCEGIPSIDITAAELLDELRVELEDRGITLLLARVKGPVRDMMRHMREEEGVETLERYATVEEAVNAARSATKG